MPQTRRRLSRRGQWIDLWLWLSQDSCNLRGTDMTQELKIATAQFENRSGDKEFNLAAIEDLSAKAALSDADVVAFHECSVTGYTFARRLSREQLWDLAEVIPDGTSTRALIRIAERHRVSLLAGLFERGDDGRVYKA